MNRERSDQKKREEDAKRDRAFQYQFPVLTKLGEETGDWGPLEEAFAGIFPEQSKSWKKQGSPYALLGPVLTAPSPRDPNQADIQNEQSEAIAAGQGTQPELPSRPAVAPMTPAPPRKTLFGVEMPTDEEKFAKRTKELEGMTEAGINAKLNIARRLAATGQMSLQEAMVQVGLKSASQTREPFQAVTMGTGPGGESVGVVFNQETGAYETKPIPGLAAKQATGTESDMDAALDRYARGQGLSGRTDPRFTFEMETEARKKLAEAVRAPTTASGGQDMSALAGLAVRNPAVLQGLTPTESGKVLNEIAKNPPLRAEFEKKRMEPVRQQAQTMLDALGTLVVTDGTGKVVGLTQGARTLFGEYTPVAMRGMFPSATDANAALQQITGQQILDTIAAMKAQSRTGATGFGQLSVRELDVLSAAATQLTRRLSEPEALKQLGIVREKFAKILMPAQTEMFAAGPIVSDTRQITLDTPYYIDPATGRPRMGAPAPASPAR